MAGEDDLTREEWNALGDEKMIALLMNAWGKPFVSLTDAVHWVATNGVAHEPDYDELVAAADSLIRELKSKKIVAMGIPANGEMHQSIPADDITSATTNGTGFLDDHNLFVLPCIQWAHDPGEDRDLILGKSGPVWSRIAIKRDQLRKRWPAWAASQSADGQPASGRRGRGRPTGAGARVLEAMRKDIATDFDPFEAKEIEMEARYKASRDTCRRMRAKLLSEKTVE